MNKFLGSASIITSLAFAGALQANGNIPRPIEQSSYFSTGVYGGIKGGYNYMHNKFKAHYIDAFGDSFYDSKSKGDSGVIGTIFLGWEKNLDGEYFLGAELEALIDSNETKATLYPDQIAFKYKGERRWGIIPSLKAGMILRNNLMGYFRLGLSISDYHLKIEDVSQNKSYSKSKVKLGIKPAVGLAYAVTNRIAVLGEVGYNYSFGKIHKEIIRDPLAPTIDILKKGEMKNIQSVDVQVGVSVRLT